MRSYLACGKVVESSPVCQCLAKQVSLKLFANMNELILQAPTEERSEAQRSDITCLRWQRANRRDREENPGVLIPLLQPLSSPVSLAACDSQGLLAPQHCCMTVP